MTENGNEKKRPFEGWIASLSDGTQRFETALEPGKISPWQGLLKELRENPELKMTGLQLKHFGLTIVAAPHKSCDGYIQVYEARKKLLQQGGTELLHGVGSVHGENVFITWINLTTGVITQDVRSLASSRIHTTVSEVNDVRTRPKGNK